MTLRLLINNAVLHNESHASEHSDVFGRVALDSYEVGEKSVANAADLVVHSQNSRVDRRCRSQGVDQRHSPVDHCLDLAGIVAVGKDSNVAAAGDRDTGRECLLKYGLLSF